MAMEHNTFPAEGTCQEPTILEYARFYGLAEDYLSADPLEGPLRDAAGIDINESLNDLTGLEAIDTQPKFVIHDKLSMDKRVAAFLHEMIDGPCITNCSDEIFESRRSYAKSLVLETPLLRTDSRLDFLKFARRRSCDLSKINLLPEELDEENDEGLTWPKHYYNLPTEFQRQVEVEKLKMPTNALFFLQSTLGNVSRSTSAEQLVALLSHYRCVHNTHC
jgi:hypothetical protein